MSWYDAAKDGFKLTFDKLFGVFREVKRLKLEIQELREKLSRREKLVFESPVY